MHKLLKSTATHKEIWGDYYEGGDVVTSQEEDEAIHTMQNGTMPIEYAKSVVTSEWLQPERPGMTRIDFAIFISALIALYPNDASKPHSSGKSVREPHINAAMSANAE